MIIFLFGEKSSLSMKKFSEFLKSKDKNALRYEVSRALFLVFSFVFFINYYFVWISFYSDISEFFLWYSYILFLTSFFSFLICLSLFKIEKKSLKYLINWFFWVLYIATVIITIVGFEL